MEDTAQCVIVNHLLGATPEQEIADKYVVQSF